MPGRFERRANLSGKVAAILGGSGGVGRAVTLALAECGVDCIVLDNDVDTNADIAQAIEGAGARCLGVVAGDVVDPQCIPAFYKQVAERTSRLDIVVNVAGGTRIRPFLEGTEEQDSRDIRLNYGYVVDSVKAALPLMMRSGEGGSIVNFTTVEAYRGAATIAVYAGAKAAVTNFTRSIAVEFAEHRIRCNTVVPDTTPSKGNMEAPPPSMRDPIYALPVEVLQQGLQMYIPLKQPPEQEALADAALFLASDLARSVTGSSIVVDGGTLAAGGMVRWPFGDGYMPSPLSRTMRKLFMD
jgi:NAD(P)-dependent dehydrogenase (short-subunit alcohol dehydrogenase family)